MKPSAASARSTDGNQPLVLHTPSSKTDANVDRNLHVIVLGASHGNAGSKAVAAGSQASPSTSIKYGTRSRSRKPQEDKTENENRIVTPKNIIPSKGGAELNNGRNFTTKINVCQTEHREKMIDDITGMAHAENGKRKADVGQHKTSHSEKKVKLDIALCEEISTSTPDKAIIGNHMALKRKGKAVTKDIISKQSNSKPSIRTKPDRTNSGVTAVKSDHNVNNKGNTDADNDTLSFKKKSAELHPDSLVQNPPDTKIVGSLEAKSRCLQNKSENTKIMATIKTVDGKAKEVEVKQNNEKAADTSDSGKSVPVSSSAKLDFLVEEIGKIVKANDKDFSQRHINAVFARHPISKSKETVETRTTFSAMFEGNNLIRVMSRQNEKGISNDEHRASLCEIQVYDVQEEANFESDNLNRIIIADSQALVKGNDKSAFVEFDESVRSNALNVSSVTFDNSSCQTDFPMDSDVAEKVTNPHTYNTDNHPEVTRTVRFNSGRIRNKVKELTTPQQPEKAIFIAPGNDTLTEGKSKEYELVNVPKKAYSQTDFEILDVESLRHSTIGPKQYRCKLCDLNFNFGIDLNRHVSDFHKDAEGFFSCTLCNKTFSEQRYLRIHLKRHVGEGGKKHTCPTCGWKFFELNKMKLHMEKHKEPHLKTLPYKCTTCKQQFYNYAALRDHVNTHTGNRPYRCNLCNSDFTHEIGLRRHRVVHERVGQYKCEYCEKSFKFRNKLTEHLVTHTKHSKHHCESCGNVYGAASSLRRHKAHGNCSNGDMRREFVVYTETDETEQMNALSNENLQLEVAEVESIELNKASDLLFVCAGCRILFNNIETLANHVCSCVEMTEGQVNETEGTVLQLQDGDTQLDAAPVAVMQQSVDTVNSLHQL